MRIVAIETATSGSSVALGEGLAVVASAERIDRGGHAAFLVPALDFCFDQAGWSPSDVGAVVVDVGPGLYTGIRVGLATAQGLAAAVGAPVIPASSLDALALRATTGHRHIWAVVDVRRGELAVASYRPVPGGVVKDDPPRLMRPDQLRASLESDPDQVLMVGDAEALPDGILLGLHRVKVGGPRYPSARALVEVGAGKAGRDEIPRPDEVRPLYLRDPDITINWAALREQGPWPT
ncbi:MAG: tRNA (adenosine(37)-N6)-threonylcarbamoyltransferase complex dimerization subunit type 1 TsaB [Acidimicrobiia bacterium]